MSETLLQAVSETSYSRRNGLPSTTPACKGALAGVSGPRNSRDIAWEVSDPRGARELELNASLEALAGRALACAARRSAAAARLDSLQLEICAHARRAALLAAPPGGFVATDGAVMAGAKECPICRVPAQMAMRIHAA